MICIKNIYFKIQIKSFLQKLIKLSISRTMQVGAQLTHGVIHTVLESQKEAFSNHVNSVLQNDKDVGHFLPISSKNIFDAVQDGIILCKLINKAVPGRVPPISPQAINIHPSNMYHKIENLNLAIESARSIGCVVINLNPQFVLEKRQHIVLGLIWQIIRIHISNQLTLRQYPQLILLKKPDEEDDIMQKLGYQEILVRWINYHITKNGGDRKVNNLGKDLSDGYGYGHVLQNVSNHWDKGYWEQSSENRSTSIIHMCNQDGIKTSVQSKDILSGNPRLNAILLAEIFNDRHGLVLPKESIIEIPAEPETDESREIRVFKNWINSQGIEDVYVNYLMNDLRDGRILLKVIDHLRSGIVEWNKYSNKLHSRIHIVQNCNYVIDLCKDKLGVKIIGIGGLDIVDAKTSLTLGVVWQLCKVFVEERVGKINEQVLIEWGNSKVPAEHQVKSMKDKSLKNCQFFLNIIEKIRPGTVDFTKVKSGDSQEEQISKINYTIAAARKLGGQILTLWQHINEVNPRFVSLFIAELQYLEKNPQKN